MSNLHNADTAAYLSGTACNAVAIVQAMNMRRTSFFLVGKRAINMILCDIIDEL
jgi:hypothetical protein